MTTIEEIPSPPAGDQARSGRRVPAWLAWTLAALGLCAATYLYWGYRYNVWPQPGFLANVLTFSGQLQNDWYTSDLPPGHWALDHALGLLPGSWLEPSVGLLWMVGLLALWGGFLLIADALGLPPLVAVLAGLVLVPTGIGGFGVSESLVGYFYPSTFAFGLSLLGLGLTLRDRWMWAGAAVGAAVLFHPGVGPFAVLVTAPVLLWRAADRRRDVARYAVPLIVLGLPSIVQLVSDQLSGGTLTPSQVYDFEAIVRIPHHVNYAVFPVVEYARTAAWSAGLIVSLAVLWRMRSARSLALVSAVIAVTCGLGAAASFARWPVLLVEIQTARLSSYVIALAALALAAALYRRSAAVAVVVLALTFLLAGRVHTDLIGRWPAVGDVVRVSFLEAVALGAALLMLLAVERFAPRIVRIPRGATVPLLVAALAGCALSLVALRDERRPVAAPLDRDFTDVADHARMATSPRQLVLTPPVMDGFRSLGLRPDVVEWGSIRLGHGDVDWRQRMLDVTGNPAVLDPDSTGTDFNARLALIERSYSHEVATSANAVCRYRARLVIARRDVPVPRWLRRIYENGSWQLLAVRPQACRGVRYRPVPDPVLGTDQSASAGRATS